ncbi:MAG: hypothetical protein PHZ09_07145 [Eubacteriales bacterium]|nr:hypothetical protein [Eubacteriales bacterium]
MNRKNRWNINGKNIEWQVSPGDIHTDDIEMSGLGISYIVKYGTSEDNSLFLDRYCVWPTLRTIPNNTHASYQTKIHTDMIPIITIDGQRAVERPFMFTLDGTLRSDSITQDKKAVIRRICFPSNSIMSAYEIIEIDNISASPIKTKLIGDAVTQNSYDRGTKGVYITEIIRCGCSERIIKPNETGVFALTYSARIANAKKGNPVSIETVYEQLFQRKRRVCAIISAVELDTGNKNVDTLFRFAKLRAGESIFKTKCGLLHSPGGGSYYAATWCNDEIEYAGPWLALTGDSIACEAALNAYKQYIPFMSEQYISIPSSVIAEGNDIWEKDRGDEAMYAYGASLYALIRGDRDTAEELFPAILWCIEYCLRRRNKNGVIASETDELEGRFPTGDANLSTSSLCYGGIKLASYLAEELDRSDLAAELNIETEKLGMAIESFFGADIHGFKTYRYYDGNTTLRSWICLPLCMGINKRLDSTVAALTSPYLWTKDGLLTEESTTTVWDRSTLYCFRGAFLAGAGDKIIDYFNDYTACRLLGERVPYPIEAFPEGNKRHLSAESALYCRIISEDILGLSPKGLHSFTLTPRLPRTFDHLNLHNIHAFGSVLDIEVNRETCRVYAFGKEIASVPLDTETLISL